MNLWVCCDQQTNEVIRMHLRVSKRELVQLAGWVLPVLAAYLFTPGTAQAGCGDYHQTNKFGQGLASSQDAHPAADHLPGSESPKPCSGPNCSRAPAVPTVPPTTPTRTTDLDMGWCLDGLLLVSLDPSVHGSAQQNPQPIRFPSDVFHPPRQAA
jgi:hypothetical protein